MSPSGPGGCLVHVLLVEDDDRVAGAVRALLARQGMTVRRVARGRDAVGALSGVDVVLLDLGLPDLDGIEVCRAVRAVAEVPVIVLTARGGVDERILGLHCGADDYVVKPCDPGELVARIHAAVVPAGGRQRSRRRWCGGAMSRST